MNKGVPPARLGKDLDLPVSFHGFEFFLWPAAFYLIFKNDAEMSFIELPLDACAKALQAPVSTELEVMGCFHIINKRETAARRWVNVLA